MHFLLQICILHPISYRKTFIFDHFWLYGKIILLATKPAWYLRMHHMEDNDERLDVLDDPYDDVIPHSEWDGLFNGSHSSSSSSSSSDD